MSNETEFKPHWEYNTTFRNGPLCSDSTVETDSKISYEEIVRRLQECAKRKNVSDSAKMETIYGRYLTNSRGLMDLSYAVTKSKGTAEAAARTPGYRVWFYPDPSKPEWETID